MTSPPPGAPTSLTNLPPFLTPDALDTLTVLSSILSRLQPPTTNPTGSTAGSPPAATPSQLISATGPLSIKDIPAATDELKHKLHKARLAIRELPDVERSVEEQDGEIAELESRIREQRKVLEGLRGMGEKMRREGKGDGDEVMES